MREKVKGVRVISGWGGGEKAEGDEAMTCSLEGECGCSVWSLPYRDLWVSCFMDTRLLEAVKLLIITERMARLSRRNAASSELHVSVSEWVGTLLVSQRLCHLLFSLGYLGYKLYLPNSGLGRVCA